MQPSDAEAVPREVYTIGHSNHTISTFLELLGAHGIGLLVDVRSSPYSKYTTQFDREALEASLSDVGIGYLFLGDRLGGRPAGPEFYDDDGYVRYWRIAQTNEFQQAVSKLEQFCDESRVVLMCSEEDPAECHRRLLVGRVLFERGTRVQHIRAGTGLESEDELLEKELANKNAFRQLTLFEEPEVNPWRSTRSVLPKSGRRSSSDS